MSQNGILHLRGLEGLLSDPEQLRIQIKANIRVMRLFGAKYRFGKDWNKTNPRFTYRQIERILKDSPAEISAYELISDHWRVGLNHDDYYEFRRVLCTNPQINELYELVFNRAERMYGVGSEFMGISPLIP